MKNHIMCDGLSLQQAVGEAARCHLCHDAPCSKACPAGTDPATFIRKLRLRNIKGAMRTVKQNNCLAGVCGVVCPTEQLCQKACVAAINDRPIDIGGVQRFLVEHAWDIAFNPIERMEKKSGNVAVIGSGPAGIACAVEIAASGYDVTIFDSMEKPGGVLRYGVPSFRLSSEFLDRELEVLDFLGIKLNSGKTIPEGGAEELLKSGFNAIFFAPGTWKPVDLDIPGISLDNVTNARDFLAKNRTDERDSLIRLVKGKNVAVYGGGSVAMDVATSASKLGASKVYVIYRRSLKEMPASKHDFEMALASNVIFKPMSIVQELIGQNGKLVGLKGCETDWKNPDDRTSDNLVKVDGTDFQLKIDLFVSALGYKPEPLSGNVCTKLEFDQKGLIKVKEDGVSTANPAIFAGGDIVRGPALVVEAVADGKNAGRKIIEYLSGRAK
ncbi:MAG: FAD-dependent oxidoreductase [Candidatus Riflebacteria bacterium]|nr:FAD-dependent oxidoreductase [Candidatus Riflebacteria bacterium]